MNFCVTAGRYRRLRCVGDDGNVEIRIHGRLRDSY